MSLFLRLVVLRSGMRDFCECKELSKREMKWSPSLLWTFPTSLQQFVPGSCPELWWLTSTKKGTADFSAARFVRSECDYKMTVINSSKGQEVKQVRNSTWPQMQNNIQTSLVHIRSLWTIKVKIGLFGSNEQIYVWKSREIPSKVAGWLTDWH